METMPPSVGSGWPLSVCHAIRPTVSVYPDGVAYDPSDLASSAINTRGACRGSASARKLHATSGPAVAIDEEHTTPIAAPTKAAQRKRAIPGVLHPRGVTVRGREG